MSRAGLLLCATLMAARAAAQGPDSAVPLRLVRCAAKADVPCLEARVPLDAPSLALIAKLDSTTEAHAWVGDLAGRMLVGPAVATARSVVPPLRLLILLDRSGSMIGEGIAYTRSTLREFVEGLDSASVRVAVAGFESHAVADGIAAAEFVTPHAAAEALAALPKPDPRANTALYSALVDGSTRVAHATAQAPGTQGAILLVTDGRNDVGHAGDDPGLLTGAAGLTAAVQAAATAHQRVWIMGVGADVAADTLALLVGDHGSATVASLNPNVMAERLQQVSRELRGARDLLFGMPTGGEVTLARTAWRGSAAVWVGNHAVLSRTLTWRPPLFALPAYRGVANAAELTPALSAALTAGPGTNVRLLFALFLGLVGAALWILVPRLLWIRAAAPIAPEIASAPRVAPTPAAPEAAPAPAADSAGGLRTDVTEVAPRTAADVTNQTARRTAPAR